MVVQGDHQMARTNKPAQSNNGFAIPLQPDTDLGLAMLIAEDEEGQHEPVAVAGTIQEAKEIAESDLRSRMRRLERGDDPGICPYTYKLWAPRNRRRLPHRLRDHGPPEVAPPPGCFSPARHQPRRALLLLAPVPRPCPTSRHRWPTRQPVAAGANVGQTWLNSGQPSPRFQQP